jgi:membrane protease YdiL (CAAX protease family)
MVKINIFYATMAGIVGCWIIKYLMILKFGERMRFFDEMLKNLSVYDLINILLYTVWAPLIEETLFRGFFLEILKPQWNNTGALLLSSLLFTLPHMAYPSFYSSGILDGLLIVLSILMDSIIFGMAYIRGGLIAAIIVHAFSNSYMLIL